MKNKYFKNLFQSITFFGIIFLLDVLMLWGFLESLTFESNNGWILLVIAIALISMYFIIGFYWIFQTVEINGFGITIKIFNKIIKIIRWEDVDRIEYGDVMRNPSYTIFSKDGSKINIDARKGIRHLINEHSNNNNFYFKDRT